MPLEKLSCSCKLQIQLHSIFHYSLTTPNRTLPLLWRRNVYQPANSDTNSFQPHAHHQIYRITPRLQFVTRYSVYSAFLLSVSWATQLSLDVPSDTSFLRNTAAVIGEVVKILCVRLPAVPQRTVYVTRVRSGNFPAQTMQHRACTFALRNLRL